MSRVSPTKIRKLKRAATKQRFKIPPQDPQGRSGSAAPDSRGPATIAKSKDVSFHRHGDALARPTKRSSVRVKNTTSSVNSPVRLAGANHPNLDQQKQKNASHSNWHWQWNEPYMMTAFAFLVASITVALSVTDLLFEWPFHGFTKWYDGVAAFCGTVLAVMCYQVYVDLRGKKPPRTI